MIYGTAWKEAETTRLTRLAIEAGFRGIDTANQRRHYFEAAVGEALRAVTSAGTVGRDDLFVQTKFTYVHGQDHRLPYDPKSSPAKQVEQSMQSSLEHLGVDRVDAYLLHGPSIAFGLSDLDWQTWAAMEDEHRAGRTRLIGVSNVTHPQLEALFGRARIKPALVQNRCFTRPHADRDVRAFCKENGMLYEGFSLLTAHRTLLQHPSVHGIAARLGVTPAQVVLRYCLEEGMLVLTGTTSKEHMDADLRIYDFELEPQEIASVARLVA